MYNRVWFMLIALTVALLPLGAVSASATKPAVKVDNKADFAAVSAAVQKEMAPGGRYEFVNTHEIDTVTSRLHDMHALLDS
jgi:hypothetical protein